MASIQRIFPRLTTQALSFIRHPAGGLGVWDQVGAVYSGQGARYVGPFQGSAQQQAVPKFNAIPNGVTQTILITQLLSDPLREVLVPAADWNVAFAAQLANAGASYTWQGMAALFVVNALTGERRATVFDITTVGSGARSSTAERTVLGTVTGYAVQIRAGDFLCLELGMAISNAAAALAPQASVFADGTTPITVDDAATSDALTVLEMPESLLLSLPQAGEQPDASVSFDEAFQILKDHWPPYSSTVYDWDAPDAIVHKFFRALADVLKLYLYDQSDRLAREVNPLTMVELIPFWEALLGITLSETALRVRSADQRRQAILARLREMGPLTVHNLAAIFSTLAGYVPPAVPEVIEMGAAALKTANEYSYPVNMAIPTGTAFDGTNLIQYTQTLLDGGKVWDTGALVTLVLSSADSQGLHVQLTGPDFTTAVWTGGPNLDTTIYLRSPAHARGPIHGNWVLNVYRDIGAPAVNLVSWKFYVLGRDWGGRAGAQFIWSVYLDPAHQMVDRRDIESTLDRITQSYADSFVIYDKTSTPGTNTHRAGRFIPGM